MSTDPTQSPAPKWWAPYIPWLIRLAIAVVSAYGTYLAIPPAVIEVIKEVPVAQAEPRADEFDNIIDRHGWRPDAEAADLDAARSAFRTFADTPAGQVAAVELPKQVFGWQAIEKLTGKPTPLKDQNPTGSCVGFGTTTAIENTLATEILLRKGDPSEFTFFSEEVTYAGSKVQGARAMGASVSRSDGSAGVFVKAFFENGGGMVPKGKYGATDLTTYDATRARSWNLSGPPAEVLAVAKKYPVKSVAKVTNWAQAKQAMASGYFPSICASWSYSRQRDANGVAAVTREGWSHCMALTGYYVDPATGKEYGHIENSWTNLPDARGNRTGQAYHTGPTGWGNPTTAGFWATSDSIDRALKQGDSYAYSGVTGFPAKRIPLDWNVQNHNWRNEVSVRAQDRRAREPKELFSLAW